MCPGQVPGGAAAAPVCASTDRRTAAPIRRPVTNHIEAQLARAEAAAQRIAEKKKKNAKKAEKQ